MSRLFGSGLFLVPEREGDCCDLIEAPGKIIVVLVRRREFETNALLQSERYNDVCAGCLKTLRK